MIDIKFLRENPDVVKQNIKNKFQDQKLPLVDEVIALDKESRACKMHGDELRSKRKSLSDKIGSLMKEGRKDEAEAIKAEVKAINDELVVNEEKEEKFASEIKERMMKIPNIIDPSVPIGKDDSENVEVQRFGEPKVPDYEIPYHADIIEKLNGMDKESAGRTSGVGFYYLIGDIARLHEAMLACARDYMFIYISIIFVSLFNNLPKLFKLSWLLAFLMPIYHNNLFYSNFIDSIINLLISFHSSENSFVQLKLTNLNLLSTENAIIWLYISVSEACVVNSISPILWLFLSQKFIFMSFE